MHNCQKKAYSSCGRFQKAGRLLQLSIVHNTAGKAKKINPTTRNTTIETNEDIPKEELQKLFPYSSPRGEAGINLLTMLAALEAKQRRLMSKVFT